jgi:hypothetical protein
MTYDSSPQKKDSGIQNRERSLAFRSKELFLIHIQPQESREAI